MSGKISAVIAVMSGVALFCAAGSGADTVYFNSGGTIEGVIKTESADSVEVDVGFGTITCNKDQIKEIYRSTAEELFALREKWENKKKELEAQEEEFFRERERRFTDYEKQIEEEQQRKTASESGKKEIKVKRDEGSHGIIVDALLNDSINVSLVLDTGASLVVLSKKIGEELGVDLADTTKDMAKLHVADNRAIDAKLFMLKSVRVQEAEVNDVMAAIIVDDIGGIGSKDGLLGMSFLGRFNLKIDLANMKMTLESINKQHGKD
ncbi:MAG: retropepsin-like aspartic protease [Candidatus Omnitrophota bacterium]